MDKGLTRSIKIVIISQKEDVGTDRTDDIFQNQNESNLILSNWCYFFAENVLKMTKLAKMSSKTELKLEKLKLIASRTAGQFLAIWSIYNTLYLTLILPGDLRKSD